LNRQHNLEDQTPASGLWCVWFS